MLYKQLLAWILEGRHHDPYEEFFIAKASGSGLRRVTDKGGSTSQLLLSEDSSQVFASKVWARNN